MKGAMMRLIFERRKKGVLPSFSPIPKRCPKLFAHVQKTLYAVPLCSGAGISH